MNDRFLRLSPSELLKEIESGDLTSDAVERGGNAWLMLIEGVTGKMQQSISGNRPADAMAYIRALHALLDRAQESGTMGRRFHLERLIRILHSSALLMRLVAPHDDEWFLSPSKLKLMAFEQIKMSRAQAARLSTHWVELDGPTILELRNIKNILTAFGGIHPFLPSPSERDDVAQWLELIAILP